MNVTIYVFVIVALPRYRGIKVFTVIIYLITIYANEFFTYTCALESRIKFNTERKLIDGPSFEPNLTHICVKVEKSDYNKY